MGGDESQDCKVTVLGGKARESHKHVQAVYAVRRDIVTDWEVNSSVWRKFLIPHVQTSQNSQTYTAIDCEKNPICKTDKTETSEEHLRRWLVIPLSFASSKLYGRFNKLQMPFISLVEQYKVTKAWLLLTLQDSKDMKDSEAGIQVTTGRKWSVSCTVVIAESGLKHQDDIVGNDGQGTRQWQTSQKEGI